MSEIPIENWWPQLDVEFKHAILADLDAPLSDDAVLAIARIHGGASPDPDGAQQIHLTERDRDFIRTQIEAVD